MPIWAGKLSMPGGRPPLKGLCISHNATHASPGTSRVALPKSARMVLLGCVDPARVPLWMAAGPVMDVYTTAEETEEWFRGVFRRGMRGVGREEEEEGEDGEEEEEEGCSGVGLLVGVRERDGDGGEDNGGEGGADGAATAQTTTTMGNGGSAGGNMGDWAVTEMLLYGHVVRKEVDGDGNGQLGTPPKSSPTAGKENGNGTPGVGGKGNAGEGDVEGGVDGKHQGACGKRIIQTTITIHALPLSSRHNFMGVLGATSNTTNPSTSTTTTGATDPSSILHTPRSTLTTTTTTTTTTATAGSALTHPKTPSKHLLPTRATFLLPNPLDSPQISKSVKKRRAEVLSQAVENRKRQRTVGASVPPPEVPGGGGGAAGRMMSREPSMARVGGSVADYGSRLKTRSPSPEKRSFSGSFSGSFGAAGGGGGGGAGIGGVKIKREPSSAGLSRTDSWPKFPPNTATATSTSRPASRASGAVPHPPPPPVKKEVKRETKSSCATPVGGTISSVPSPEGYGLSFPPSPEATTSMSASKQPQLARPSSSSAAVKVETPSGAGGGASQPQGQGQGKQSAELQALLTRLTLSGMKLYGLKRGDEDFKWVYHHVVKAAGFALRDLAEGGDGGGGGGGKVSLVERGSEVVGVLLGLFCGGAAGAGVSGRNPVVNAMVEVEGLRSRVGELERELREARRGRGEGGRSGGVGGGGGGGAGVEVEVVSIDD